MDITTSSVHRMVGSMKCGCRAQGEYSDSAYKKMIGEVNFLACSEHTEDPSIGILKMMLSEYVEKEAKEFKLPTPAAPVIQRPQGVRSNVAGVETAADGHVERTPLPARPHRPQVSSGDAGRAGIQRLDPRQATRGASTPGQHRPPGRAPANPIPPHRASTMAAAPRSLDLDIGEQAEDPRITHIVESIGLLDMGDDDDESGF